MKGRFQSRSYREFYLIIGVCMGNEIFESIFREKAELFRSAFSTTAKDVFYDAKQQRIFHAGEYGMYREAIVRDFLKFIVPRSLDISTGFVITSHNDVSTQCDIVVFDSRMTPLYQDDARQRFFPVESVFCVGEVKSNITKPQLSEALKKLAATKALSERIQNQTILRKSPPGPFDPVNHPYDLVPTFLICQKLDFDLSNIENDIDALYGQEIEHRHKHNIVLSIENGLLTYYDKNDKTLPFIRLSKCNLKNRLTYAGENQYVHFKLFASYIFMLTTSKTLLYPEFSDYIGAISGGFKRDQA